MSETENMAAIMEAMKSASDAGQEKKPKDLMGTAEDMIHQMGKPREEGTSNTGQVEQSHYENQVKALEKLKQQNQ